MEEYSRFSLVPLSETESSLLDSDGQPTSSLAGVVLEKAYLLKDGRFLLISTDDCPYEEGIHITLLRKDGVVDERIDRVAEYHAAVLTDIRDLSQDTIQITISDQENVQVSVDFDGYMNPLGLTKLGFKSDRKPFERRFLKVSPLPL